MRDNIGKTDRCWWIFVLVCSLGQAGRVLGLELRPPGLVDFTLAARVDPSNERRTLGRITATVNGDMRGI